MIAWYWNHKGLNSHLYEYKWRSIQQHCLTSDSSLCQGCGPQHHSNSSWHGIIEHLKLAETHRDHKVQLPTPLTGLTRTKPFDWIVQTPLEPRQPWYHDHFPREPAAMTDHPPSEEPFPDVPSELPLKQIDFISSCPITRLRGIIYSPL